MKEEKRERKKTILFRFCYFSSNWFPLLGLPLPVASVSGKVMDALGQTQMF